MRRLRTDRIALYYLHRVDPETPLEDSIATIDEFRRAGRIGLVGLSEVSVEQIERARQVAPIAAVQSHFNLFERKHDRVVDYCAEEGIPFVPYFPLKGGARPEVAEIAERHGATPAQVVLAWLLRRSPTMLPIPGTLSLEHLRKTSLPSTSSSPTESSRRWPSPRITRSEAADDSGATGWRGPARSETR